MKITTIGLGLSVIFLTFNLKLSSGQSFDDILRKVSVVSGTDCNGAGSSECGSCTSETCGQTCQGRIRYPIMHVLSSTSYHFSYCVQSKSFPPFPTSAETDSSRQFTFKTNQTCSQELNVSNAVTVSFWIKGSCSSECEFMTVSGSGTQEYKWSLDGTVLKVNDKMISTIGTNWKHIAFRFAEGTHGFFVHGSFENVNVSPISNVSMVKFGPYQGFGSGDSVGFLDVRVFEDFLTDREIASLNNTADRQPDPNCRCSVSHPKQSNTPDTCEDPNDTTSTTAKYQGDNETFYDIKAVFDNNSTTVWTATSDVTLKLELYDVYEVTKVNIEHEGAESASANGRACTTFTSTIMTCTVVDDATNEITLEVNVDTAGNMSISDITVSGGCDCNGLMCTRPDNYQSYTCDCKEGVTGKYCTKCNHGYFDYEGANEVCKNCNCSIVGSSNSTCDETGNCYCRDESTNKHCTPKGTISPSYGPMAGGTTITIEGTNFGLNPSVQLGGKTQTLPTSRNNRNLIKFNATNGTGEVVVELMDSGEIISLNLSSYKYKPNPSVDISMTRTNVTTLKGCKMKYKGSNFNSVFQPKLEFKTNTSQYSICNKTTNDMLECIVDVVEVDKNTETYLHLDCPDCGVSQNVTIGPDPIVNGDMDVDFTHPFTQTIKITGSGFAVCEKDEIKVFIGDKRCVITEEIKDTEITCEPPDDGPKEEKITVVIGTFYRFDAGKITYRDFVHSSYFVYIMVGIVGFVLLVLVIFVIICCKRKKKRNNNMDMVISEPGRPAQPNSYTEMQKSNIDIIRPPTTDVSGVQNSAFNPDEFEETKNQFLQKLPHGLKPEVISCIINENEFSFGKICTAKGDKARIIDGKLTEGNTTSRIMVKSVKKPFLDDEDYPEWVFKVLTECVRFKNLSNPNILSILGIGLEKRKFHILYPYMKNRTLKDFVSDEKKEFSLKQLLGYGIQISEGMCFLYDHNIVHEDLATRNCMVTQDSLIKISDSAYSHDFFPTEYMLDLTKNRYLPIRWMAPESIKFGFYDIKSDVWSYGVLLWELLTRGCLPFIDTADTGVYDLIIQGFRLGKPEIISDEIYDLINKCWEEESEFRPSFTIIRDTLSSLMAGDGAGTQDLYINWTEPRQSIYVNSESFRRRSEKNQSEPYYGNL